MVPIGQVSREVSGPGQKLKAEYESLNEMLGQNFNKIILQDQGCMVHGEVQRT